MELETDKPADARKPSALARLHQMRLPLWVSLLLLALLIVLFAWSRFSASGADRRPAEERQQLSRQLEAEKSALQRDAQEALARQTRDLQALFGTALAWSVLRSSDRKYLQSRFAEHFPAELLKGEDVAIHPDEGNRQRLVLPIQGLTARPGTVLVVYAPPG